MHRFSYIVIATLLLSAAAAFGGEMSAVNERTLTAGWEFRQKGSDEWHPATVPGCVHTDLLDNGLIEDPFYRDNERRLQWIGKTDWEYRTRFELTPRDLNRDRLELLFDGLDTYAEVYLNGKRVLDADNMFRTWRVDEKGTAKAGRNELRIVFRSPINEILPMMKKLPYKIPAPNDQGEVTSPYTRKAPYQFGWDWGPRFVTSGVWRPVRVRSWNTARIEDVNIRQIDVRSARAKLIVDVEIESAVETDAVVAIRYDGRAEPIRKEMSLKRGSNVASIDVEISSPKLWFPSGLGEQALYNFTATLKRGDAVLDREEKRTGLRSLELRQKIDKWGKSFEFVINGIPVFGKGGNWIPADSFPNRVSKKKYRHLLESFRDANMNMIRVWGGGIYEEDYFYELADELGLLIWQDFMFGVSMYPGDAAFLENVRREAIDNVKRLRNHPSIILWCGNNESETAWQHWGWKERLPDVLWENYKKIFLRVLPSVVERLDPSRPYWSSSPSSDLEDDAESQQSGDLHYWAVWHAEKPFSEYEKQYPRFMSEYGFQSFPDLDTVASYTTAADRESIETPVMLAHQRHPRGNQLIRKYMLREFNEPKDFRSFLYVSQVLQAEGIRLGTEHLRRIMPRNMGALYWQLNDCWPVASWSSTDYYGRWKALHFYARRFFNPVLVSPRVKDGMVDFFIVSDLAAPLEAELNVRVTDLEGRGAREWSEKLRIEPLTSRSYVSISLKELLSGHSESDALVSARVMENEKLRSSNELFLQPYKDMRRVKPDIKISVSKDRTGLRISLSTDKVARGVFLRSAAGKGRFSDNYFNLLPGMQKSIMYAPREEVTLTEFEEGLEVISLADAFPETTAGNAN